MVRKVNVEPVKKDYTKTIPLTLDEVKEAFEECLKQVHMNMEYFGEKFPWSATKGLKYPIIENIEWTDGFW